VGFEGASTYIDETLIAGVLAGILLLLLAAWLRFANNWLWRTSLSISGSSYLRCVELLGLKVAAHDSGPRVRAEGCVNGMEVDLMVEGSYRGLRLVCRTEASEEPFISKGPLSEVEPALTNWLSSHKEEARGNAPRKEIWTEK
jgi:hypothetical protein